MAVKEIPINFRTYYKSMKDAVVLKRKNAYEELELLSNKSTELRNRIHNNINLYTDDVINVNKYDEYVRDAYIDGKLLSNTKKLLLTDCEDPDKTKLIYDVYEYADNLYNIEKLALAIALYDKVLTIKLSEYNDILRFYYGQVHKKLVLEGAGYSFGKLGWICINRCVLVNPKPMIDYKATKLREQELKRKGIRIYNQIEADFCKANNIEYKAEDKRVFKNNEYCYEIPLIGCKLPNGSQYKLEVSDYRHSSIRGKSNEELAQDCNNNTEYVCELPIDIKTKVTICDKLDSLLYLKFIRNEHQKPFVDRTNYR